MTATNGHTNGASSVPPGWLKASQLVKEYGGSLRSCQRWGTDGRIGYLKDEHGVGWFNPEDYVRELGREDVEQNDGQKTRVVLDGANELLKQAMGHLEKVFTPAQDATREVLDMLRKENADLRAQNAKLLDAHLANVAARESLLNEEHMRQLTASVLREEQERKRQLVDNLKGPAKLLLARALGMPELAAAAPGAAPAPAVGRIDAARRLLASLTEEQLTLLVGAEAVREALAGFCETELLSAEQKELARAALS